MDYSHIRLNLFTIIKFSLPIAILALTACIPPPPPPLGTSDQAIAARAQFATGLAKLSALETEYASVINRFTDVAVVNKIISEPPKQIILDIPKADIDKDFGVYKQNANGTFEFFAGGFSVGVEYNNGIDLQLYEITYHPDTRLKGFKLAVSSNNRQIDTPASDEVTINITEFRPDLSKFVPTLLNTGASTEGTYAFTPNGATTPVEYQIKRNQGTVEAIGLSMQAARQLRFQELSAAAKPFWESLETIIYLKSELPGVWWGFSATQAYADDIMSLNIHMVAQEQSLATTGLASFRPFARTSRFVYQGARVADIAGGAYTCDMNVMGDVGTGTSIDINWIDGTVEKVFPSLKFPCSRTVLSLPALL